MNNILELIEIIKQLGGSATTEQICGVYLKQHKMMLDSSYLVIIENILRINNEVVVKDLDTNKWQIVTEEIRTRNKNNLELVDKNTSKPIQKIIAILEKAPELIPDEYDASYEVIKKTIAEYKKSKNLNNITVDDMNFLYSLSVGTWKISVSIRKDRLKQTCLSNSSKNTLLKVIDDTWNDAKSGKYKHHENEDKTSIGMFGTGFMTFSGKLSDNDAQKFIKMCVSILDIDNENDIYNICEKTLSRDFVPGGLKAASASFILHCLKPYVFPIISSNGGHGTIYENLGINTQKESELNYYIDNCRAISKYRNEHFKFKNYRILDVAKWALDDKSFDLYKYLITI